MSDFIIEETIDTPLVVLNFSEGSMKITGKSIPENATNFYNPILNAIDKYKEAPAEKTLVEFHLEYFNTSSSKYLLDILRQLQVIYTEGNNVEINWYHDEDDDEILEIGEDFSSIVNIPFNIKMILDN